MDGKAVVQSVFNVVYRIVLTVVKFFELVVACGAVSREPSRYKVVIIFKIL